MSINENESKNKSNNYNEIDKKLRYGNKEIYYENGKNDPAKKVAYSEYNLVAYDTVTKTKTIIANTFNKVFVIYEKKLYYSVNNFQNKDTMFYCYNLDTNEKEDLKIPYKLNIYSIVAYNNKIYFGVSNSPIGSEYGIFDYDIETKEYNKYSELDIRYLNDNFLFVNDGFVVVKNNQLIHLDLSGASEVKYKLSEEFKGKTISENIKNTESNVICLIINGEISESRGTYLGTVAKIYLDISQNYKLIKTELLD